jgi:hypothetical protein
METSERSDLVGILGALTGLVIALLLVGVVSHTPLRHAMQVTPAVIAAVLVAMRARASRYAALPIFVIWLFLMTLIWLFLLGITRIITGTFTTAETVLTLVIGFSSLWGTVAVLRRPRANLLPAVLFFVVFTALQFAAVWMSLRPAFARR